MARSSITGIERTPPRPAGRDTDALGPSDSSDSGSDIAGADAGAVEDPSMPLDLALSGDYPRALTAGDVPAAGSDTDRAGTGERGSATAERHVREGGDIAPDQVEALGDLEDAGSAQAIDASLDEAFEEALAEDDEDEADPDADLSA